MLVKCLLFTSWTNDSVGLMLFSLEVPVAILTKSGLQIILGETKSKCWRVLEWAIDSIPLSKVFLSIHELSNSTLMWVNRWNIMLLVRNSKNVNIWTWPVLITSRLKFCMQVTAPTISFIASACESNKTKIFEKVICMQSNSNTQLFEKVVIE